jgi:LPS sulfotransferase NodH
MQDEVAYWQTKTREVTDSAMAEAERMTATTRDIVAKTWGEQSRFAFELVKHNMDLVQRQVALYRDVFKAPGA